MAGLTVDFPARGALPSRTQLLEYLENPAMRLPDIPKAKLVSGLCKRFTVSRRYVLRILRERETFIRRQTCF